MLPVPTDAPTVGAWAFTCEVCGTAGEGSGPIDAAAAPACPHCGASPRDRGLARAVSLALLGRAVALVELPIRHDLDVLGLQLPGPIAEVLSSRVSLHQAADVLFDPLELGRLPADVAERYDLVACVDLLNHVPGPVQQAIDTLARLLRPGGRLVVVGSESADGRTDERVGELHDWAVAGRGDDASLINRTADGDVQVVRGVRLLGGDPTRPELRLLGRDDLRADLQRAGLETAPDGRHVAAGAGRPVPLAVGTRTPRSRRGDEVDDVRSVDEAMRIATYAAGRLDGLGIVRLAAGARVARPAEPLGQSVGMQALAGSTAVLVADGDRWATLPQPLAARSPMVVRFAARAMGDDAAHPAGSFTVAGEMPGRRVGHLRVDLPLSRRVSPPAGFDVLAILTMYNESDIVEAQLRHLVDQGIRCHVIDNWSTDGSADTVATLAREAPVTMERFPASGPAATYDWTALLNRVEEVAERSGASWVIHHDIDEVRLPPWDATLRDALWTVQECGYNAIDHTVVQHHPTARDGATHEPLLARLPWCEFERFDGNALQVKAWRVTGVRPLVAPLGGHDVGFCGRRVFPLRFALHHFPIRSQEHGERKVLRERRQRWNPEERAKGWHTQYDHLPDAPVFVKPTEGLLRWKPGFERRHLRAVVAGGGVDPRDVS